MAEMADLLHLIESLEALLIKNTEAMNAASAQTKADRLRYAESLVQLAEAVGAVLQAGDIDEKSRALLTRAHRLAAEQAGLHASPDFVGSIEDMLRDGGE